MSRFVFTWGTLILIWIGFTGSLDSMKLMMGVAISLIIAFYAHKTFSQAGLKLLSPRRLAFIVKYMVCVLMGVSPAV